MEILWKKTRYEKAVKLCARAERGGDILARRTASGDAHQTPKTLSRGRERPACPIALPLLRRYNKVQKARYLHDACYAANENLSAVELSAVLMGTWAALVAGFGDLDLWRSTAQGARISAPARCHGRSRDRQCGRLE